jgi:putative phosphoesterase
MTGSGGSAQTNDREVLIGVISDTHGYFPLRVSEAFAEVDLIIHAGDFNTPEVYEAFKEMGPLKAIRGNVDYAPVLQALPETEVVQVGDVFIYVIHDILDLQLDPEAAGFHVVIHGHLHIPQIRDRDGTLYLNPGSPTTPRQGSKPGVALLRIQGDKVEAELIHFEE